VSGIPIPRLYASAILFFDGIIITIVMPECENFVKRSWQNKQINIVLVVYFDSTETISKLKFCHETPSIITGFLTLNS